MARTNGYLPTIGDIKAAINDRYVLPKVNATIPAGGDDYVPTKGQLENWVQVYIANTDASRCPFWEEIVPAEWRGADPYCQVAPSPVLSAFDYAVIRYRWAAGAGRDLDTFTTFYDNGTPYDNIVVGYHQNPGPVNGYTWQYSVGPANDPYLNWGNDNTESSGVEPVLVNFKKFAQDFTSIPTIVIRLAAAWFSQRGSGNIEIEIVTYSGGTMEKSGFDFVNRGGNVVQQITFPKNIPDPPHYVQDIDRVVPLGFVTYTPSDWQGLAAILF